MQTIEVVAAVIEHDQRVLAARRKEPVDGAVWEFPGGKIEAGESLEQALTREIQEELGVTLQAMWPLDTIECDYSDFHLIMHCFGTHLPQGQEPKPLVHDELRWLEYSDLLTIDWIRADRKLAEATGVAWGELFYTSHGC